MQSVPFSLTSSQVRLLNSSELLAEQLDNTMRLCGQTVINYTSKAFAPQWCGLPEQFHCAGSGHI